MWPKIVELHINKLPMRSSASFIRFMAARTRPLLTSPCTGLQCSIGVSSVHRRRLVRFVASRPDARMLDPRNLRSEKCVQLCGRGIVSLILFVPLHRTNTGLRIKSRRNECHQTSSMKFNSSALLDRLPILSGFFVRPFRAGACTYLASMIEIHLEYARLTRGSAD